MTPFRAYQIYTSIVTHFKTEAYDAAKYGFRTNASESSFMRRKDAPFFYRAVKVYKNHDDWINACVASVLADKGYIANIFDNESIIEDYLRRRENVAKAYQEDLRNLLDMTTRLNELFIQGHNRSDPLVISEILTGNITYESAVAMDKVFKWVSKARCSDTLLWPDVRMKLQKYHSFLPIDRERYSTLTEKVIRSHI